MGSGNFGDSRPALILLSGLPGAGKTTFASELRKHLAFEHVESDRIRAEVAPVPRFTPGESGVVFRLAEAAVRRALGSSCHAVLDATNLTNKDRRRFLRAAEQLGALVVAVRIVAPEDLLRARLAKPREGFSKAGEDVLDKFLSRPQAFSIPAVVVDSRFSLAPAIELILALVHGPD